MCLGFLLRPVLSKCTGPGHDLMLRPIAIARPCISVPTQPSWRSREATEGTDFSQVQVPKISDLQQVSRRDIRLAVHNHYVELQ